MNMTLMLRKSSSQMLPDILGSVARTLLIWFEMARYVTAMSPTRAGTAARAM